MFNYFSRISIPKSEKFLGSEGLYMNHNLRSDLEPFSETEFLNAVNGLKYGKAVGHDAILELLLKIINRMKHLIPKSWCQDLVNPIFKDDDRNDPNNYRGICTLSALLKIICSMVNDRPQLYCQNITFCSFTLKL